MARELAARSRRRARERARDGGLDLAARAARASSCHALSDMRSGTRYACSRTSGSRARSSLQRSRRTCRPACPGPSGRKGAAPSAAAACGARAARTGATARCVSSAASRGSLPSPSRIVSPPNAARFAAMLPPGVCRCAGHGDAEGVVLDVEEHRQLERGGDVERRPEAVGRRRGISAEYHGDAARVAGHPRGSRDGSGSPAPSPPRACIARLRRRRRAARSRPPRPGRLNTTPISRPSLKDPERASGPAAASSRLTPSASMSGRER